MFSYKVNSNVEYYNGVYIFEKNICLFSIQEEDARLPSGYFAPSNKIEDVFLERCKGFFQRILFLLNIF